MAHKVPHDKLHHCPPSSSDNGDRTSGGDSDNTVFAVNGVTAAAAAATSATVEARRSRCLAEDTSYTREREGHSGSARQERRKGRDRREEEEDRKEDKRIEDWREKEDRRKKKGRERRQQPEEDWRERNHEWEERKNKEDLWRKEKRERRENPRETGTRGQGGEEWSEAGDRRGNAKGRRELREQVGREEGQLGEGEEEEEDLEGHKEGEEVRRSKGLASGASAASVEMAGGSACDADRDHELVHHGMVPPSHQADHGLYTSDEWEESELSDSQDDHSDSSDDDDPKSQVDRLIEQVTLVYLDGENSNLSSESEDYDDSDSESDITDVSPLVSATASPLGLSPVLPRRTLGTSPLALHDNRGLGFNYGSEIGTADHNYELTVPSERHSKTSRSLTSQDPSDMTVLLKAVVELEENQRREQSRTSRTDTPAQDITPHPSSTSHHPRRSPPMAIHPIDASPHHRHLRRAAGHRRKNMSFPNEEVRRIDRENQMLLEKIMSTHNRTSTRHHHHHHHHHHSQSTSSSSSTQSYASNHHHHHRPVHRPANSTINRRREEEKIRRENMILLRRIQEAKPSREVTAFRSSRHHRPTHSLAAAPGSCGASARTAPGHVAATATRRKETAL